jgi:hypothetical protein
LYLLIALEHIMVVCVEVRRNEQQRRVVDPQLDGERALVSEHATSAEGDAVPMRDRDAVFLLEVGLPY